MTLDRVRVHLFEKTAAVPGIGFVACTRVRHPWDMIFEKDLPEYEHFMNARRTPAFRERRRFEMKQEARVSRTLRRYGYCEADLWTAEEVAVAVAEDLIKGLRTLPGSSEIVCGIVKETWMWIRGCGARMAQTVLLSLGVRF